MKTIHDYIREGESENNAAKEVRREDEANRVYKEHPELKAIKDKLLTANENKYMAIIDKKDRLIQRIEMDIKALNDEWDNYVSSHGIDPDFEETKCFCKKCNDTGYITRDGLKRVCSCKRRELERCYISSGMGDYTSYRLENYQADYFTELSNRQVIRDSLIRIVINSNNKASSPCWLYCDRPQSGKTFLTIIMCKLAIELCKSTYFIKCEELSDISREKKEELKRVDFLVIDDFADTVTRNSITASVLNNILEARTAESRPTVLVTTQNIEVLKKLCDMRISSKLSSFKIIPNNTQST